MRAWFGCYCCCLCVQDAPALTNDCSENHCVPVPCHLPDEEVQHSWGPSVDAVVVTVLLSFLLGACLAQPRQVSVEDRLASFSTLRGKRPRESRRERECQHRVLQRGPIVGTCRVAHSNCLHDKSSGQDCCESQLFGRYPLECDGLWMSQIWSSPPARLMLTIPIFCVGRLLPSRIKWTGGQTRKYPSLIRDTWLPKNLEVCSRVSWVACSQWSCAKSR